MPVTDPRACEGGRPSAESRKIGASVSAGGGAEPQATSHPAQSQRKGATTARDSSPDPAGPKGRPENFRSPIVYAERWEAGISACREGLLLGAVDGNERGGIVFRLDKKWGYVIRTGGLLGVRPLDVPLRMVPKGSVFTGMFHVHPTLERKLGDFVGGLLDLATEIEVESTGDKALRNAGEKKNIAAYLANPSGAVFEWSHGQPYRFPDEVVRRVEATYRESGHWPATPASFRPR